MVIFLQLASSARSAAYLRGVLPLLILPLAAGCAVAADNVTFINTAPERAAALANISREIGKSVSSARPDTAILPPGVIVWEATAGSGGEIDDARAVRLREFVRRGGSLLLTLSREAGTGPFRLATMLPTAAWKTRVRDRESQDGALALAETDADMYGAARPTGFFVPYWYEIRPVAAVERGEARYDRFERPVPYLASTKGGAPFQPPGTEFWTRSLLSREWRIRSRGAGVGAPPLLITGRYGAGRVAVFASTAESQDTPAERAFWSPVLKWLLQSQEVKNGADAAVSLPAPKTRVDVANRKLRVTLSNPAAAPLSVHLIGRILTWEHAFDTDSEVDAVLPAGGSTTVSLPLPPPPGSTGYQALAFRDAYTVRLGVLSLSGSDLLAETKAVADLSPALSVTVSTDPAWSRAYPFHAPPPFDNEAMGFASLGMPLPSYGYKPGAAANVTVTIANGGMRNLAPMAIAADAVDPANASAIALNDEASLAEKKPSPSEIHGWGAWEGEPSRENIVSFTFQHPVTVTAVTLLGAGTDYRRHLGHNPSAVIVEADGRLVAQDAKLTNRFSTEGGHVRVALTSPVTATVIRLRFPAMPESPIVGDVEIAGWDTETGAAPSKAVSGILTVSLVDALTGNKTPLAKQPVTVTAGARQAVTIPLTLPAGSKAGFFRVDAVFLPVSGASQTASVPLLTLLPKKPIAPRSDLFGEDAVGVGFIVTRGFRNIFATGTGTAEIHEGWGQPDDLVWAFERGLKQLSAGARTEAGRLYVSESDMRHYSTPWRSFFSGEQVYDAGTSLLVDRFKQDKGWAAAKTVHLGHSDRWDTGPEMDAVYSWQDFEGFNARLRSLGLPGLTGKTREDLSREVETTYKHQWSAFHLTRYVHDIAEMRDAFAKEGKSLVITAQGYPLVPPRYQDEVAGVLRGMSDDSTWGMEKDSIPLTTGRQMGVLAFSPDLQISTLSQWGYDSGILQNPKWHAAVGTTEPSRRTQFDRAFRGVLHRDGTYTSEYAYGYNTNAGYAYTFNANDFAQWMQVQEKQSLLTPDAPIGAGLVTAAGYLDDPNKTMFAAGGSTFSIPETRNAAVVIQRLHEAGISIPFVGSASTLDKWPLSNPPIILVNPQRLTAVEAANVKSLLSRGVRVAAFVGGAPMPPETAAALAGALMVPLDPASLMPGQVAGWEAKIAAHLKQVVTFPAGTAGYGFRSAGRAFIVVEDWREEGRTVEVRYHPEPGVTTIRAADASEHRSLDVRKNGDEYVINVPLRPGDGALVAIEEEK